jgi:hypothetical protein
MNFWNSDIGRQEVEKYSIMNLSREVARQSAMLPRTLADDSESIYGIGDSGSVYAAADPVPSQRTTMASSSSSALAIPPMPQRPVPVPNFLDLETMDHDPGRRPSHPTDLQRLECRPTQHFTTSRERMASEENVTGLGPSRASLNWLKDINNVFMNFQGLRNPVDNVHARRVAEGKCPSSHMDDHMVRALVRHLVCPYQDVPGSVPVQNGSL